MSNRRDFTKKDPRFTGQIGAVIPTGTTADRDESPALGTIRYNTSLGLPEFYTDTGWSAVAPPPVVNNITGVINVDTDSTITISGSGFDPGAIVSIIGDAVSGSDRDLATTFVSSSELTANTNASAVGFIGNASFDVKVTNTTGLSATLTPGGVVDRDPVWSTAAGNRGSFGDRAGNISVTHSASDPDGNTVTYSLASGQIPPGTTLNTSTGTISGNPSDVGSDTTFTYTLRATANGFSVDRTFSITITLTLDGSSSTRAAASALALFNDGQTSNGTYWIRPSGYGGSAFQIYCVLGTTEQGLSGGWMRVGYAQDNYSQSSPWTGTGASGTPGADSITFPLTHSDAEVNAMLATASEARQSFTSFAIGSVGWTYQGSGANQRYYMTVRQFQDGTGVTSSSTAEGDYWGGNLSYVVTGDSSGGTLARTYNNSGTDPTDANDSTTRSSTLYIRDVGPSKLPIRRIGHSDVDGAGTEARWFPGQSANNFTYIR